MSTKTTRMELIHLKRRILFAKRGHKLLKDKRDSMMASFFSLVRRAKQSSRAAESLHTECNRLLVSAASYSPYPGLLSASISGESKVLVKTTYSNIASIRIPAFSLASAPPEPSLSGLSPKGAEKLFRKHRELVLATLELAGLEKGIRLMAEEIESTNRRVNALEHILIPRFESDARAIEFKLEEREREMFATLSRISE
ncbi:MAG: V-type ATP synthase subunit D [Candidatus Micrarchaeota archaeon]